MNNFLVVLSGPACSGKSTLAGRLCQGLNAKVVTTQELIRQLPGVETGSKGSAERVTARLDRQTHGKWIAQALAEILGASPGQLEATIVVDPVTTLEQVANIRKAFGTLLHVHLDADPEERARRFSEFPAAERGANAKEIPRAPKCVEALANLADVVIRTDRCTSEDVYARVVARLGARPGTALPNVDVLIGGQYGSEGKGNIAHYLAPEYEVLVRVGGPNAGHKVFVDEGEEPYTFRQLPSGALANGRAMLVIGAGAVIGLEHLLREISELDVPVSRLIVDPQAMIIEPADNEWERENLRDKIASTAQGVGRATARKILHRYPGSDVRLARDAPELKHYLGDTVDYFADCLTRGRKALLEGTQGTLLSLHHGYYPHVTSRVTTVAGCLAEAGLAARHVRRVVMVCRTFPIRVGNTDTGQTSGFMAQEIDLAAIAARASIPLPELQKTETTSTTKRPRRIAEFDWTQFRRAIVLNGPTDIALTFADYLGVGNRNAFRYEQLTPDTLRFIEELENVGGVPVTLVSTNFSNRNIIDRRAW